VCPKKGIVRVIGLQLLQHCGIQETRQFFLANDPASSVKGRRLQAIGAKIRFGRVKMRSATSIILLELDVNALAERTGLYLGSKICCRCMPGWITDAQAPVLDAELRHGPTAVRQRVPQHLAQATTQRLPELTQLGRVRGHRACGLH
jgi:hypothetical protein